MAVFSFRFFSLPVNSNLLLFIFFGTLCSYSFHWYLSRQHEHIQPRELWSIRYKKLLLFILLSSFVFSFIFFIKLNEYYRLLVPLLFFTFLYTAPKIPFKPFSLLQKYVFAKTLYLTVVWSVVTVVIPLVISADKWIAEFTYFTLNRFFMIFAICILFDLRDKEIDRHHGVKSIITILDKGKIRMIFFCSLVLSGVFSFALLKYGFRFWDILILLIPVIFVGFADNKDRQGKSELWFYLYLDGLMMLSGILFLLKNIIN